VNGEFVVDHHGDEVHVLLAGEVDRAPPRPFISAIRRALSVHPDRVVINVDAVTFLDSTGLGAVVAGYREARAVGVGYRVGPSSVPRVARVLALTGLDEALTVEPSDDENGAGG